jgi:enoyl-CoA hydratase
LTARVERDGAVAVVTLDNRDGLNVLDALTMTALRDRLLELEADRATRAVVLTGNGDRAFSAGADVKYMRGLDASEGLEWGRLGHQAGRLLETMPKVTIAAVNGLALGGGCELALACDIRFASAGAKLGQPEILLALFPGWGGTQRLARATSLGFARDLVLTGRTIGAEEALERGLVSGIHDPVLEKALEVARAAATRSTAAIAAAKELLNSSLQGGHAASLALEAERFGELFAGTDAAEGLGAFLEKREPRYSDQ